MSQVPFEISHQQLPGSGVGGLEYLDFAPSLPLHGLERQARSLIDTPFEPQMVGFPYANDESATYWEQAMSRIKTAEYQAATNRTALLVGESSLAAALPYITENTIVLVDANVHSCIYMQHYVDCLRTAPTIDGWRRQMATVLDRDPGSGKTGLYQEKFITLMLKRQIKQWHEAGLQHALGDEEAYQFSSQLARQKAIVPWHADLQDPADMQRLAGVLKAQQATITMANLTNVVDHLKTTEGPLALEDLPMTEHAPILATSMAAVPRDVARLIKEIKAQKKRQDPSSQDAQEHEELFGSTYLAGATGPFFGLRNFVEEGGSQVIRGNERLFYGVFRRRYLIAAEGKE